MKSSVRKIQEAVATIILVLGALASAGGARASNVIWCVVNDTDFASAAEQATLAPTTIKLVKGTYHVAGTKFAQNAVFHSFELLGGYSSYPCTSRTIDPANTTIIAGQNDAFGVQAKGDVTIEGIGFAGASAGILLAWDDSDYSVSANVNVTVRRNSVSGASSGSAGGGIDIFWLPSSSQTLSARIVENLLHDNVGFDGGQSTCGSGGSNGVIYLDEFYSASPATWTVVNNTVVNNTFSGGICVYGGNLQAYNNILHGNNGPDLFVSSATTAFLEDNVIGSHVYNGSVIPIGTLTGDPKLDAQFHPIESPASPVINAGYNNVPGGLPVYDLTGGPRTVGSTVDLGVYESSIVDKLTQTVSNTNDSGLGSLRAAIDSINANGSGIVEFKIGSSCGPHVITLNSTLAGISKGGIINGYTQPGASQNDLDVGDDATICVILEAGNSGVDTGLSVPSGAGDADTLTIEGLAFSGFSSAAIDLEGGSLHTVIGNHFGGSVGGHTLKSNQVDVQVGTAVHDMIIGGVDVADRNIIGDAHSNGIWLQGGVSGLLLIGANNNQIVNNYIGVGWNPNSSAYTNRGNGSNGIRVDGHDNTFSGNLIGDNGQAGVAFNAGGAQNNVMDGSFIGVTSGGNAVGNGTVGVLFEAATGGAPENNIVRDNTIEDNAREGIWVQIGQGNKLRRNSIAFNGMLGIDLAAEGVNPNDDDGGIQQANYANHGQNYPVLTGASGGFQSGYVSGSLITTGGNFTLDFYASGSCDASGHGPGLNWLGSASVTVTVPMGTDEGFVSFNVRLAPDISLLNGTVITATATNGNGDTSEFSACATYLNDTIFANGFEPLPF